MKIKSKYLAMLFCLATALSACQSDEEVTLNGTSADGLLAGPTLIPYAPGAPSFTFTSSATSVVADGTITLTVTAIDSHGNPFSAGVSSITFNMSGGTSTATIGVISPKGNGIFEAILKGNLAGTPSTVRAVVNGNTIASTVSIGVTTGNPKMLIVVAGNNQSALQGTPFLTKPKVKVADRYGNAVANVPVLFEALSVGSSYDQTTTQGITVGATPTPIPVPAAPLVIAPSTVGGGASVTINTDANGFAEATWDTGATSGLAAIKTSFVIASGSVLNVLTATSFQKPTTPDLYISGINGKIDLAWVLASNGGSAARYTLFRSTNPVTGFVAVATNLEYPFFSDIDAISGVFYYYVIANNGYINSDPSPTVSNLITVTNLWTFLTANAAQFTYNPAKINFSGDVCSLAPTLQTDNSTSGFTSGTSVGTTLSGSVIKIANAGGCDATQTDCNPDDEQSVNWTPQWANVKGYWKLNGTVGNLANGVSISSTVPLGTLNGTTVNTNGTGMSYTAAGKLSQAINFDGVDDYVNIPNGFTNTIKGDDTHTIAMWVKFNNVAATLNLLDAVNTSNANGYSIFNNGAGGLYWECGGVWRLYSGLNFQNGVWYHIAVSKTGTLNSGNLFINGVYQPTYTGTLGATPNENSALYFGSYRNPGYKFNGTIDDVAIWNSSLSQAEIQLIYEKQVSRKSGVFTSRVMDGLTSGASWTNFSWLTTLPFSKALSNAVSGVPQNEKTVDYPSLVGSNGVTSQDNTMFYAGTPNKQVVGQWHFDETSGNVFEDTSGQANTNTVVGAIGFTSGRFGGAANFNGASYINIPYKPSSRNLSTAWTIQAWVKEASVPVGYSSIVTDQHSGAMQFVLGHNLGNGLIYAGAYTGSVWFNTPTGYNVPLGIWTHLVGVYDGSQGKISLYANGNLVSQVTGVPSSLPTFGSATHIGKSWNNQYFNGAIDEVAIWNRPLHSEEVLQLYRRGANRVKFQVRTCTLANCANDPNNTSWKGPTGDITSYFSEFNNKSVQGAFPSGGQKLTQPSMLFTNFNNPAPLNRYFQYRAILESDDNSTNCGGAFCSPELTSTTVDPIHYETSGATVVTNNSIPFTKVLKITQTLGTTCISGITYNLSLDKITWYYWSGTAWAVADGSNLKSNNSVSLMGAGGIANFERAVGTGSVYVKAFLNSTGTSTCALTSLKLEGQ